MNWLEYPKNTNYLVSDTGLVKSKFYNLILATRSNENGYLRVNLWDGQKCKRVFVHKLVMETFIGDRPTGMIIRHYPDQNPENNNLTNLSYSTSQQNNYDRIEVDTYTCAKLTPEDVLEIKEALINGIPGSVLTNLYEISPAVISNIKHNNIWKNVGPDVSIYYKKYAKQLTSNIKEIFNLREEGWTCGEIAEKFGLDISTIQKTLAGIHNK